MARASSVRALTLLFLLALESLVFWHQAALQEGFQQRYQGHALLRVQKEINAVDVLLDPLANIGFIEGGITESGSVG